MEGGGNFSVSGLMSEIVEQAWLDLLLDAHAARKRGPPTSRGIRRPGSEPFGALGRQGRFELLAGVVELLWTGPGEDKRRGDQNPFCCLYGLLPANDNPAQIRDYLTAALPTAAPISSAL